MSNIKIWLSFYLKAKTIYSTHSPFLFDIYENILTTDKYYYDFQKLEQVRKELIGSSEYIEFKDFGAGSKKMHSETRMIRNIAKYGISSEYQCRVLFNLVNFFKPKTILEFGTSLGLSSMYMASARKKSTVYTLEANEQLSAIAKQNCQRLALDNVVHIVSTFDDYIVNLEGNTTYDFVYLDGNHTYEATIRYLQRLLAFLSENAVIMIDDIHWSEGMYEAWGNLKKLNRVNSSVETQYFGLLFLDNKLPGLHHVHIDYWLKPWQIGLFA